MFFILQVKYDVGLFAIHKYIISTLQKITSKLKYCLCRRRTWSCVANRQMGFQDTVYCSFVESLFVLMMHGVHVYFRKKRMKVVDCTLLVEEIIDEVPLHLLVCVSKSTPRRHMLLRTVCDFMTNSIRCWTINC